MQSFLDHPNQVLASECHEDRSAFRLTGNQMSRLASLLQDQLEEMHRRLGHNEELFRSLAEDASVDGIERQAARHAAEQDFESIQATNVAIAAMGAGAYGLCVTCETPIPFERLEAIPATQTCVVCPDA